MNSFITEADFDSKTVTIITVRMGHKPYKAAFEYLSAKVEENNGIVKACYNFHGAAIGKTADEASLQKQIEDLKL
jgi:hypothetical protein